MKSGRTSFSVQKRIYYGVNLIFTIRLVNCALPFQPDLFTKATHHRQNNCIRRRSNMRIWTITESSLMRTVELGRSRFLWPNKRKKYTGSKLFLKLRSEERRVGKECRSGWGWEN